MFLQGHKELATPVERQAFISPLLSHILRVAGVLNRDSNQMEELPVQPCRNQSCCLDLNTKAPKGDQG